MYKLLPKTMTMFLSTAVICLYTGNATLAQSSSRPMKKDSSMKNVTKMSESRVHNSAEPFAFIELFTSEGCSSCPSADQNLERIATRAKANGQNVYTLSYHVDYWNYLGWEDPYSSKTFSDRQREYAQQFESSRIYTPQMVINGPVSYTHLTLPTKA